MHSGTVQTPKQILVLGPFERKVNSKHYWFHWEVVRFLFLETYEHVSWAHDSTAQNIWMCSANTTLRSVPNINSLSVISHPSFHVLNKITIVCFTYKTIIKTMLVGSYPLDPYMVYYIYVHFTININYSCWILCFQKVRDDCNQAIKIFHGTLPTEPLSKLLELLDTQVFSGSVQWVRPLEISWNQRRWESLNIFPPTRIGLLLSNDNGIWSLCLLSI